MPPPLDLLPPLLRGVVVTIEFAVLSGIVALTLSFIVGLLRLSPNRYIRAPLTAYVEVFRGTSALVQLFIFFYVLPHVGLELPAVVAGTLALGLNGGAYGSEIVRAAVLAVDRGQWDASIALNMTRPMTYRLVVLPQAIPAMLPSFGNMAVELVKGTALVSLITLTELAFAGRQLVAAEGRVGEVYLLVLLLYFLLTYPLMLGTRWIERRRHQHVPPFRAA